MKIRLDVEGTRITAILDDNETARDFVSLFPLALTFEGYAQTGRINNLQRRFSTTDAPAGTAAVACDISYYVPWGNLALLERRDDSQVAE
jgi:hypothetical protein